MYTGRDRSPGKFRDGAWSLSNDILGVSICGTEFGDAFESFGIALFEVLAENSI